MPTITPGENTNNPQTQSAPHPRPSAANNPRRRGAPRGNLNALKHGRRSRRFNEIGALVAQDPALAQSILRAAGRQSLTRKKTEEAVALKLAALFLHAESIAKGNPSPGPFLYLLTGDPADIQAGAAFKKSITDMAAQAIANREARKARRQRGN